MSNTTLQTIRSLVEDSVYREIDAQRLREASAIARGLRMLYEHPPKELPAGLSIEDECATAETTDKNRLRISKASQPYIHDLRRAVLLERWLDQIQLCPTRDAAHEVSLMWESTQVFSSALTAPYVQQIRNVASRFLKALHFTAPALERGDDYLSELWRWLCSSTSDGVQIHMRLATITDHDVVEQFCRMLLSRDLILPDELDDALKQSGFSSIRARLKREPVAGVGDQMLDDLLRPEEAAKLLGISVETLNNKKSRGEIPASVYAQPKGSRIKYRRQALLAWHRGMRHRR